MTDYALAGGRPNDVSFGLLSLSQALAGPSEHATASAELQRIDPAEAQDQLRRSQITNE